MSARVAVIGGGFAGCAAAVALAGRGAEVTLFEAAPVLGGRARRVERDGLALDNGQHLMLGAYRETRALVERTGGPALALEPLALSTLGSPPGFAMRARDWPAPFGLLAGIATARGLTPGERFATLRWFAGLRARGFRCAPGATVAELTAPLPARVRESLWHPLCLAALNTLPQEASAQLFANVIAAAFDGARHDADAIGFAGDLSALLPEPCARFLEARGHRVRLRTQARVSAASAAGVTVATGRAPADAREDFDAALVAVGPHQLAPALDAAWTAAEPRARAALDAVHALAWEPITTVYLGYDVPTASLGLPPGLLRLDDAPGQWLFAREDIVARAGLAHPAGLAECTGLEKPEVPTARMPRALLAVVISARGPHDALPHDALAHDVAAQLARLRPSWPAPLRQQVIEEHRATYRATPQARRPAAGMVAPRVALAGDYTDDRYPATLEAAVRSGNRAADALARALEAR